MLVEYHIYRALQQDKELVLNDKLNYSSHLIFNKILDSQTNRASPLSVTSRSHHRTGCAEDGTLIIYAGPGFPFICL